MARVDRRDESEGTVTDIRLGADGDIDVSDFNSPRLFAVGEDLAVIAQRVLIRLRTFKGEWFLDENIGVPYFQQILGGKGIEAAAAAIFRSIIEQTDGITKLESISVKRTDRLLSISFRASTDAGALALTFDVASSIGTTYSDPSVTYSASGKTYGG